MHVSHCHVVCFVSPVHNLPNIPSYTAANESVLSIDILSAKTFNANRNSDHMSPHGIISSKGHSGAAHISRSNRGPHTDGASGGFPMNNIETRVKCQGQPHERSSSQEFMVDRERGHFDITRKGGINKTVEFHVFNESNSAHSIV